MTTAQHPQTVWTDPGPIRKGEIMINAKNTPRLPISPEERQRRWRQWWRRYPGLPAWIAAHPGEAAGRVIMNGCTVRYYRQEVDAYNAFWTGGNCTEAKTNEASRRIMWTIQPLGEGQVEVSREEYRRVLGLPEAVPPCSPLPTWPPTPEQWGKRNSNGKLKTKADWIRKLRKDMTTHKISFAELMV